MLSFVNILVYANGLWVCGSFDKGILWSEDGKSWTQGTGVNTTYTDELNSSKVDKLN